MSGRTGKLTKQALRKRGPRLALVLIYTRNPKKPASTMRKLGYVIWRVGVGHCPFRLDCRAGATVFAQSYSLSYLLRIGKAAGG